MTAVNRPWDNRTQRNECFQDPYPKLLSILGQRLWRGVIITWLGLSTTTTSCGGAHRTYRRSHETHVLIVNEYYTALASF